MPCFGGLRLFRSGVFFAFRLFSFGFGGLSLPCEVILLFSRWLLLVGGLLYRGLGVNLEYLRACWGPWCATIWCWPWCESFLKVIEGISPLYCEYLFGVKAKYSLALRIFGWGRTDSNRHGPHPALWRQPLCWTLSMVQFLLNNPCVVALRSPDFAEHWAALPLCYIPRTWDLADFQSGNQGLTRERGLAS